ncbi:HNH endonuclease signature motif containing protein [Microbacterium sp. JB110]|uniref:HNH endonuclease signature motif containing protein n=1 Tax=Microbacterium sp. JB110 TaxID=2024477 RepID=UPI00097EA7F5|nr:HNH endonuclease signature motif containing protein [Microbacterium sp. JB110]RCS62704.1 HNH endonuclease [Microbacterium sp. JB110]SJM63313.1 putative HNH endonuclease domain protein [Frigoribacterium sp. JB110]
MELFTDIDEQVARLRGLLGGGAEGADDVVSVMRALDDKGLAEVMETAAKLSRSVDRIGVVGAGVVAERSTREAGHDGFAQKRGHRKATDFIQGVTGGSKGDAYQRIRVGTSILGGFLSASGRQSGAGDEESGGAASGEVQPDFGDQMGDDGSPDGSDASRAPTTPPSWHTPLDYALVRGGLSQAQYDAIFRGLGEPPAGPAAGTMSDGMPLDPAVGARIEGEFREAWRLAAEQLVDEAAHRSVEELRTAARTIRDRLDPDGADRRYFERYEARSYRMWVDADGRSHGSFVFDDEGAAFVRSVLDSALRPRLGGPRFVDAAEKEAAQRLVDDPRTFEQLSYDLLFDVIRSGTLADAKAVHGTKQAGVRLVRVVDSSGDTDGAAHTEDRLTRVPAPVADQHACDTGTVPVSATRAGDPLNVGREHRLFTPAQRIALAVRDGGCRWRGCDRPASYCEAHHIDHFAEGGRTDVDRGILLCRFHHMRLHTGGYRITRTGKRDFVLHDPGGETKDLPPRLALEYAFHGIDPPPKRFRPAA